MSRVPLGAPILSAVAMRAAEEAVFASGVSQEALMERAGHAIAREAARFATGRPVLVVAGPGNNGGDGYVTARLLREWGHDVTIAALGEPKAGSAAAMRAQWQGPVTPFAEAEPRPVLVDGLFGTGMTRPLGPELAGKLAALVQAAEFTLSIDLPSGVETDTGADLGSPPGITATIALGALKPAHVLGAGLERSGHVILADIGTPADPRWRTASRPRLHAPAVHSHKYSRGLVVVLEGAMRGAGRLAARSALAGGAGYVILAGADPDAGGPDALVRRVLTAEKDWTDLLEDGRVGAVVVGPGLGRGEQAETWLAAAIACARPLVLDGDALSLLGEAAVERLSGRRAPTWLTPHSGEFDRMFTPSSASKIERTIAAASASGAVIVHKGADTVIASRDGEVRVLAAASSWLSTAGTGDVLAGLLGAQVAAGGAGPAEAAAWLHGRAAQLAGPSFFADQLVEHIPEAISECL